MWPARRLLPSGPGTARRACLRIASVCLPLLLLSACDKPLVLDSTLPQQFAEISCIEDCRVVKEHCNEDARYDYRQCQADYSKSFRDYRWCLASGRESEECGYSGWSCAENLYGYCLNRFTECKQSCERKYARRPVISPR